MRRSGLRRAVLALVAVLAGALAGAVSAAEPPGSANFAPPAFVPDYFSNESGAVRSASPARPEAAVAAPGMRAAAPRHYARSGVPHGRARHRVRLIHGRQGHGAAAQAGKGRRGKAARLHATRRERGAKHVAARAKPKRLARAHG